MLWLGRKLERDETDSLRAEAFPDMDTVAAANSLRAPHPSTEQKSTSPPSPSRR